MRAGGSYIADPGQLLRDMRPSVYGAWTGFWHINPWGEERADLRSAIVAQVVATGLVKKSVGAWRREEFMPFLQVDQEEKNRSLSGRIRSALKSVGKIIKAKS